MLRATIKRDLDVAALVAGLRLSLTRPFCFFPSALCLVCARGVAVLTCLAQQMAAGKNPKQFKVSEARRGPLCGVL